MKFVRYFSRVKPHKKRSTTDCANPVGQISETVSLYVGIVAHGPAEAHSCKARCCASSDCTLSGRVGAQYSKVLVRENPRETPLKIALGAQGVTTPICALVR